MKTECSTKRKVYYFRFVDICNANVDIGFYVYFAIIVPLYFLHRNKSFIFIFNSARENNIEMRFLLRNKLINEFLNLHCNFKPMQTV